MESLHGKRILVLEGALLSGAELQQALGEARSTAFITSSELSAFSLLGKHSFDGAIIDYALHNGAPEVCAELRELKVPYIWCNAPNKLQGAGARRDAASATVAKLARVIDERNGVRAGLAKTQVRTLSGTPKENRRTPPLTMPDGFGTAV